MEKTVCVCYSKTNIRLINSDLHLVVNVKILQCDVFPMPPHTLTQKKSHFIKSLAHWITGSKASQLLIGRCRVERCLVFTYFLLGVSAKHLREDVSTTVSQKVTTGSATWGERLKYTFLEQDINISTLTEN